MNQGKAINNHQRNTTSVDKWLLNGSLVVHYFGFMRRFQKNLEHSYFSG